MDAELKNRLLGLLDAIDPLLPQSPRAINWDAVRAGRWEAVGLGGQLVPLETGADMGLDDLLFIERQKEVVEKNTRQFVAGLPANNVLLWGSRGTGKSSLVRALLNRYHDQGLRIIEVAKGDLKHLPQIAAGLEAKDYRFIIYCDDLSFEEGDAEYKALKSVLDGSVSRTAANIIIYATSNRRHLLPEYASENRDAAIVNGELHHGETVEEKLSLSDRFGIWVAFHPFSQEQYLDMVEHWIRRFAAGREVVFEAAGRRAALQWALEKASRSGRTASQFAAHWVGSSLL